MRAPLIFAIAVLGAQGAGAQVPETPPPGVPAGLWDSIGKLGEQAGRMGTEMGRVFSDTSFTNAMQRNPGVMHDPALKASLHRFIAASRSGDAAKQAAAEKTFERELARAQGQLPAVPVPPAPPAAPHPFPAPTPGPMPAPQAAPSATLTPALQTLLSQARQDPRGSDLPSAESFQSGPRTVAAGTEEDGSVGTINGPLDIYGTVDGDAAVINGDVTIHPGGTVNGNVTALGGSVHNMGVVNGEVRSGTGHVGPVTHMVSRIATRRTTWGRFKLVVVLFSLLLVLGIAVLTFGSAPLNRTTTVLSEQFGSAARYGVLGLVGVVPIAALVCVGLTLTLVGILAIPIFLPVYAVAVALALLIGFFAVAETTGYALYRQTEQGDPLSERGAKLRAMVTGIGLYSGLWLLAALASRSSILGGLLHGIASAVTVVVIMVGFGAVLVAYGKPFAQRRRGAQPAAAREPAAPDALWQTPTPVGGIAAARRPTPPPPSPPPTAPLS